MAAGKRHWQFCAGDSWRVDVKRIFLNCALLIALGTVARAQTAADSIINNRAGNEVGVIRGEADGGNAFIVQPTIATLDLGYYNIAIPRQALRHRDAGGWVTSISNYDLAFIPPTDHRYFQPSGD
jgi:hypothetical protein